MSNADAIRAAIAAQQPPPPVSGLAIASLSLGALTVLPAVLALLLRSGGILATLLYLAIVGVPAVLAIVFGHVGSAAARRGERRGLVLARWGLALGYAALATPYIAGLIATAQGSQ